MCLFRIRKVKFYCQNPLVEYVWGPRISKTALLLGLGLLILTYHKPQDSYFGLLKIIISPHLSWSSLYYLVCLHTYSLHKYLKMMSCLLWVHLHKIVPEEFIKLNQLGKRRKTFTELFLVGIILLLLGTVTILLLKWVSAFWSEFLSYKTNLCRSYLLGGYHFYKLMNIIVY